MPYVTDWEARASDLAEHIARDAAGRPLIAPIMPGADEYVGISFPPGADLTDVETRLWRLRSQNEAVDVEVTLVDGVLPAAVEVEGQYVQQRVANLEPGRVYIWEVMHGEAGNRSADVLMIKCPELGSAS